MWGSPGTGLDNIQLCLQLSKAAIYAGAMSIISAPLSHAFIDSNQMVEVRGRQLTVADDLDMALGLH